MLTIICPIYNEEKYIARCIESIMAQNYPKDDLEVLFVDGIGKSLPLTCHNALICVCSTIRTRLCPTP